jgi:MFS family permease
VGWTALASLAPYYPLYALLFLGSGLTDAEVSGLFALWSVTGFVGQVPAGVLADRWSRRGCLVLAGCLEGVGFALWTALPGLPAFAAGFVVWGLGGALVSGAAEALVYDGLAAEGAAGAYARVNGWLWAAELAVQAPTAALAAVLFAAGGFPLVGWTSVVVCGAAALLALRFPEPAHAAREPDDGADRDGPDAARRAGGWWRALHRPGVLLVVLAMALTGGLDAVEEYFPVMAAGWGVPAGVVPLVVLVVPLTGAVGAALGGRAGRLPARGLALLLGAGGLLFAGAAVWGRPAALGAVAAGYGCYLAVLVVAEARLQDRIASASRATITSVAALGVELTSLLVFAAWAVHGLLGVAAVVVLTAPVVAMALRRR